MKDVVEAQFRRLEDALDALVKSISDYNPNPAAAAELVAADDELSKGLDKVARHQENNTRILALRTEADSLQGQVKASLVTLSTLRRELRSTPATSFPDTSRRVPFDELLRYATHISRHTVPPTYREPIRNLDQDAAKDAAAGDVASNGVTSPPAAALVPADPAVPGEDNAASPIKEITPEQEEWLKKLHDNGYNWRPWPTHDKIRTGGLMAIQNLLDQGEDPTRSLNPKQLEEQRLDQEDKDRKAAEEADAAQRRGSGFPAGRVAQPTVQTFKGFDFDDE